MTFKDYILNDIEEQKTLITLLPINTELRKKKYNEIINDLETKYEENKEHLKEFIIYKYQKLMPEEEEKDTTKIDEQINNIKELLILGNPKTSFFERLKLDELLYNLMHYYDLSLNDVNRNLYEFINILKTSEIKIEPSQFNLNIYEYSYMNEFILNYEKNDDKEFQKIFWQNPKVLEYIIISLRQIVNKNKKKLKKYSDKLFTEKLKQINLKNYEDLRIKLFELINNKNKLLDKSEYEIVSSCLKRELDINTFKKDSEERINNYNSFSIKQLDLTDQESVSKFNNSVEKLKYNLEEYQKYNEIYHIIRDFKKKYDSIEISKDIEKRINKKVKELNKYSISSLNLKRNSIDDLFKKVDKEKLFKQDEVEAELYKLYNELDKDYFNKIIKENIKINSTVEDVFDLYNSYRFFAKKVIKKIYNLDEIKDVNDILDKIEALLYNPNKKIIEMISIFVETNIKQQLMNGYRFENLNIELESFEEANLDKIISKCNKILIGTKVDNFKLSIEEINFLVEVTLLKNAELI